MGRRLNPRAMPWAGLLGPFGAERSERDQSFPGVALGGFVIAPLGGRTGGRRTMPLDARVRRKLDLL
jgi:hypothetical protein